MFFPITEVKCKYIASGKFDDVLRIETTPVALTKVKMEFSYKIYRDSDNTLLVEGFTQNVFTAKKLGILLVYQKNIIRKCVLH